MTVAHFTERLPNGDVRWELRCDGRRKRAWRTTDVRAMVALAELMGWTVDQVSLPQEEIAARAARVHRGCPNS